MKKEKQFVKILKDGCFQGNHYKKGQIHEIVKRISINKTVLLKNDAIVSLDPDNISYGQEAEFCLSPNKTYELWEY